MVIQLQSTAVPSLFDRIQESATQDTVHASPSLFSKIGIIPVLAGQQQSTVDMLPAPDLTCLDHPLRI